MFGLFDAYKKAFYNWLRRRMRPYSIEEAEEKKAFWARMYALVSGSTLALLTYQAFTGKIQIPLRDDLPKNVATAVALSKDEPVRFIKFKGFQKVEDFTYSAEQLREIANQTPEQQAVPPTDNSKLQS